MLGHPPCNDQPPNPFSAPWFDLSNDKAPAVGTATVPFRDRPLRELVWLSEELNLPIRPFLVGQAFEPEHIEQMSAAFVQACEALRLQPVDDPATRMVASRIIEFAQRGLRIQTSCWK